MGPCGMAPSEDSQELEEGEGLELRREAFTMALYVAVCLLAAMIAAPEDVERSHAIGIVWGISLGLVLAHLFAFRVSARLVALGRVRQQDVRAAVAQLVGGAAVALLATIPVLLFSTSKAAQWVEFMMAALISAAGYAVARSGGAKPHAALAYGLVILLLAFAIALVKNLLAGH